MRYIYTPLLSTVRFAITSFYSEERKRERRERERKKNLFYTFDDDTPLVLHCCFCLPIKKKRVTRLFLWLKLSRDRREKSKLLITRAIRMAWSIKNPLPFFRQFGARWSIFLRTSRGYWPSLSSDYTMCVNRVRERERKNWYLLFFTGRCSCKNSRTFLLSW